MDRYLSLSRSARLVGVKRGTLQKRIQAGEIVTFEGMLFVDDLLKAYPETQLEDNTMIERSKANIDNAVGKYVHELSVLPSTEVLAARVSKLNHELVDSKALAKKYITIAESLRSKLEQLPDVGYISELKTWLNETINAPIDSDNTLDILIASDALLSLMTAHIRILPSGHDFFVEGTSNLLEAGLRAGLALNYACSNGNCGQCKARIVSGEVNKISPHDYVISDADIADGHVLMCCNAAVTDVILEAIEAGSANDIPTQSLTAKVKKIDTAHDGVALLHLKTPRTQRLRFLAGQYVSLGGNDNSPISEQSVSSCPCDDMNLHFQIPKIPGNDFSDFIFNTLKNGDELDVNGPDGSFVLNEDSHHSLTFIAWHTGFAPIRSLVEHAMALDVAETISLVWITANEEDRYLDNLCRSWNDALDNFNYTTVLADLNDTDATETVNRIIENIDELEQHDIYVAGNSTLLDNCKYVLGQKMFNPEQLKLDLIKHA